MSCKHCRDTGVKACDDSKCQESREHYHLCNCVFALKKKVPVTVFKKKRKK